jgi:hypothetical protein
MLFGAMMVGTITDIMGRRKIMLFCISWFSLFMDLCAIAPSPELLGLFRFIAGLGLGGVVPTAIALTIEYAPPHRRNDEQGQKVWCEKTFVTGGDLVWGSTRSVNPKVLLEVGFALEKERLDVATLSQTKFSSPNAP